MAGFSTYQKPKGKAAPIYVPPGGAAGYAPQGTAGQTSPQPYAPTPVTPYQPTPAAAAPAVTPAAAAPVKTPAQYTPQFNYQSAPTADILGSDPFYQQLVGLNKATSGEEQAWMQAQIHRQQGYYGSESDPVSVFGRIKESFDDALRTVTNNLASHGMIFSGEYGAQNNRARLGYERSKLDANMRLQDYVEGLRKGFADAQRARQQNELQAQLDAVTRWLNTHQPTLIPGTGGGDGGDGEEPAAPGYGGGGAGTTIPGYMPAQTPDTQAAMASLDAQILANAAAMTPITKPPKFKW